MSASPIKSRGAITRPPKSSIRRKEYCPSRSIWSGPAFRAGRVWAKLTLRRIERDRPRRSPNQHFSRSAECAEMPFLGAFYRDLLSLRARCLLARRALLLHTTSCVSVIVDPTRLFPPNNWQRPSSIEVSVASFFAVIVLLESSRRGNPSRTMRSGVPGSQAKARTRTHPCP